MNADGTPPPEATSYPPLQPSQARPERGRTTRRARRRAERRVPIIDAPRPVTQGLPPDRFVSRELAWLAFNERVLEEALDPSVPLLERLKFLAIVSSNLDEFFMVRVAGLKRMIDAGIETPFTDGLTPRECLKIVGKRCADLTMRQHRCFSEDIQPRLEREGVRIVSPEQLDASQRTYLHAYFRKTILPVVTPLAID